MCCPLAKLFVVLQYRAPRMRALGLTAATLYVILGNELGQRSQPILLDLDSTREVCCRFHPDPPPPLRAQVSAGVGKPSMDSECASGCTWSTARATARLRDSRPWGSQTGQVIQGSIDTTKTRLDPQGVRMSSGERPIGTAKGKQPNTEALCQPPPPLCGNHPAYSLSPYGTHPLRLS